MSTAKRKNKKDMVGQLKVDGQVKHRDDEVCEEMDKYFASVFTREDTMKWFNLVIILAQITFFLKNSSR